MSSLSRAYPYHSNTTEKGCKRVQKITRFMPTNEDHYNTQDTRNTTWITKRRRLLLNIAFALVITREL